MPRTAQRCQHKLRGLLKHRMTDCRHAALGRIHAEDIHRPRTGQDRTSASGRLDMRSMGWEDPGKGQVATEQGRSLVATAAEHCSAKAQSTQRQSKPQMPTPRQMDTRAGRLIPNRFTKSCHRADNRWMGKVVQRRTVRSCNADCAKRSLNRCSHSDSVRETRTSPYTKHKATKPRQIRYARRTLHRTASPTTFSGESR